MRFAQTGSAVSGYSSNPVKGFEMQPSKITSLASSDVDLYAIAEGISEWVDKCKADGKPYPDKEYQTTTTLGGKYDVNYSVPNLADASPALAAWHSEWSAHFGGGIHCVSFVGISFVIIIIIVRDYFVRATRVCD